MNNKNNENPDKFNSSQVQEQQSSGVKGLSYEKVLLVLRSFESLKKYVEFADKTEKDMALSDYINQNIDAVASPEIRIYSSLNKGRSVHSKPSTDEGKIRDLSSYQDVFEGIWISLYHDSKHIIALRDEVEEFDILEMLEKGKMSLSQVEQYITTCPYTYECSTPMAFDLLTRNLIGVDEYHIDIRCLPLSPDKFSVFIRDSGGEIIETIEIDKLP